jgi:phage terminase large subunit
MRQNERIGIVPYKPAYLVHTVCDPGFTTAWWFFQVMRTGAVNVIRYYEDQGRDFDYYSRMLKSFKEQFNYNYGKHFAPVDVDNNQYKLVYGDGVIELARKSGLILTVLPFEKSVQLGIERTQIFLKSCRIHEADCKVGLNRLLGYHQKINKQMSSETQTVFGLGPEKDGNDHGADSMRYLSMAADKVDMEDNAPPVQHKTSYVALGVG